MNTRFVSPNNAVLHEIAAPIHIEEIGSPDIEEIIAQMFEIAQGNQGDLSKLFLVGLAAPQIGVSKKIILVDKAADAEGAFGDLQVYLNPNIMRTSGDIEHRCEGCFSAGHVHGIVPRWTTIAIKALSRDGKEVNEEAHGFVARIFQHEIDHLNGLLFPARISDDSNLHWVEPHQLPEYRDKWKGWPNKCTREQWYKLIEREE